ncbi:hypothetical protein D1007_47019 [Hordeum vulgare]|nr:hypothetical protein D1007_47019 [Hordeum vulgare]
MRFPLCQMIFAEDDDYPFSEDGDMDDAEFDKALYDLNLRDHQIFLQHPPSLDILASFFLPVLLACLLGKFVYGCLLTSIKKFKDSTKVASNRSVTFGGCYYAFAVSYLDNVHFGLNALPDIKPRILLWRGNKVKHFSDLDKCNSRSYGKRPLKRLSPSLYTPKSGEKFSCSKGHDVATSKIPFANNTTTSEVNAPVGSNVSFAYKVESAYASCLGNEVMKQIIDLVQKSNADKPIMFQDWSESLVLNVLGLIGDSAFKSPVHSCAEYPPDSKEDSPTFKNNVSHNLPGCKSVPIESTKKSSDDPSVSKLARNVMPDDCAKINLSSSPTTSLFAMPVAMPTSIPSGSPLKRCKPNVGMISNVRPSMPRFKSDCASKDDHCVKKIDHIIGSAGVDFEFHPATRNHSPLLRVRLSQRFIDDDGVLMVALPPSINSNPVQSTNKNHVDLSSPEALNEFFNGRDDVVRIDEVQIVGTSIFSDQCVNFTKKTNEAYNQLNKLASSSSFSLESILNNNNQDTRNPAIVRNAFEGACSAYLLWRSNFLYFPIGLEKHWFSFVVCLRDKAFGILDSAYGENSMYHKAIRNEMINNFTSLWHEFVTPRMNRRIAFEDFVVLYPVVPKQDNRDDCGVFTFKYREIFTPRTQMANLFSNADILNLRIRYANEMFFSPLNSRDKSFVTDFFLHEGNAN